MRIVRLLPRTLFLLTVLFVIGVSGAYGEENFARVAFAPPRALYGGGEIDVYAGIAVREIRSILERGGISVYEFTEREAQEPPPLHDSRYRREGLDGAELPGHLRRRALAEDADYVAIPSLSVRGDRIIIAVEVYDTVTAARVAGVMRPGLADVNLVDDAREAGTELLTSISRAYRAGQEFGRVSPGDATISLVFEGSDEGAEVYLGGGNRIARVSEGEARAPFLPVTPGSQLEARIEKEGYHEDRVVFTADSPETSVELPRLVPAPRWEFSLHYRPEWRYSAGSGLRYYSSPGNHFFGLETTAGFFPDFDAGSMSFYRLDLKGRIGSYLFGDPTGFLRAGVTTGGGIQPTAIFDASTGGAEAGPQLFVDPYLTLAGGFLEFNFRRIAPFFAIDFEYGFSTGFSVLEAGPRLSATLGVSLR